MRFSSCSDETFTQTAILNSEMRKYCLSFDEIGCRERFEGKRNPRPKKIGVYLHYIDWNPEREDPAILDESDLEVLLDSDMYFASKFIDDKSLDLIELLKKHALV